MGTRGVIVTAYVEGDLASLYQPEPGDLVVCADGGYVLAVRAGIRPHVFLGDSDSCSGEAVRPETYRIAVPVEKDETDTLLCIRYAIQAGCREIVVLGGIGGRLDHTIANLQSMAEAYSQVDRISMLDACHCVFFLENGQVSVPRQEGMHLSLLSFSGSCSGVSVQGVKYPLREALLTNRYPLGVSNEFLEEEAVITCREGQLLVILSRDRVPELS